MKEKLGVLETEKSQILTEKMQFKLQVDNICNILTSETLLKEKFKLELENTEKTKENDLKVKKDLQTKLSKLEALIKERNLEENEIFKDFLNELDSFKSVFEGLNPPYKEEYCIKIKTTPFLKNLTSFI